MKKVILSMKTQREKHMLRLPPLLWNLKTSLYCWASLIPINHGRTPFLSVPLRGNRLSSLSLYLCLHLFSALNLSLCVIEIALVLCINYESTSSSTKTTTTTTIATTATLKWAFRRRCGWELTHRRRSRWRSGRSSSIRLSSSSISRPD